jgi:hypothetical protein
MVATISSRTPEGWPLRCPICRRVFRIEPSDPGGDAPCPGCGHLAWVGAPGPSPDLPDRRLLRDHARSRRAARRLTALRGAIRSTIGHLLTLASPGGGVGNPEPSPAARSPRSSPLWDPWLDG